MQQELIAIVDCGSWVSEIVQFGQLRRVTYKRYLQNHMQPRGLPCGNSLISRLLCIHEEKETLMGFNLNIQNKSPKRQHPLYDRARQHNIYSIIPHTDTGRDCIGNACPEQAYLYKEGTHPCISFP
jgi:hypothetical protein